MPLGRSGEAEDGSARHERQDGARWYEEGVLAPDPYAVALGVGDDEDGPVLGEVGRRLEEVDAGLQDGAAATAYPDPPRSRPTRDAAGSCPGDGPGSGCRKPSAPHGWIRSAHQGTARMVLPR